VTPICRVLARSFRNLDDLNAQLRHWLDTVANPRVHATTQRVVNETFAEEKPYLKMLPLAPFRSVLKLERRFNKRSQYFLSRGRTPSRCGAGRGRQPSHTSFAQSLECFARRQPGMSPHHIFDQGALVVRQAGQHRAIVIG